MSALLQHASPAGLAILLANVAALLAIARKVWPVVNRLRDLLDDWNGEPARPGVPGRAGVMVRLSDLDDRTAQLQHNGGSTMRDDVAALRREAASRDDIAELRDALGDHIAESTRDRADLWRSIALTGGLGGRGSPPVITTAPAVVPVASAPPAPDPPRED